MQFPDEINTRTRNRQVYSPNIRLYKNTANPVRLLVKNQDQKPVPIVGFDVFVDLCDAQFNVIRARYKATVINSAKGICEIVIPYDDINSLESRYHYITVKRKYIADAYDTPAYIDDNYSVRLTVELLDGFLPFDGKDNPLDLGYVSDPNVTGLPDLGTIP